MWKDEVDKRLIRQQGKRKEATVEAVEARGDCDVMVTADNSG